MGRQGDWPGPSCSFSPYFTFVVAVALSPDVGTVAGMSVSLGSAIRQARVAAQLSVRAGAEAAALAPSHLSRLEAGEVAQPTPAVLRRIASAFACSYESLARAAGYF